MEIAAFIIVLVSALIAAGIGFGAAWAYDQYRVLPYSPVWFAGGGAVAGALISLMVITGFPFGWVRFEGPTPLDQVTPYMALLQAHEKDPEAALYERVVTGIARDREDGRSEEDVRSNAMSLVLSFATDKVSGMPDELVYEYYSYTREELAFLGGNNAVDVCSDRALGRIRGDIEAHLSSEMVERQRVVVTHLLETKFNADATKLAAEPFSVMASQAFALASEATGISPTEIDKLLAWKGGPEVTDAEKDYPAKVCKLMKSFFDAMLAQPVGSAGPALRALAAGERGG